MHSPWYNSNNYHYMEGETIRVMFEAYFIKYKVDIVFASHVHAHKHSVSTNSLPHNVKLFYAGNYFFFIFILHQEHISNIAYNIVNDLCTPMKD